jgi:hypothetical protein
MKRLPLALLPVLCASIASAQTPIIHAHLEPATGIIVGQPVHLVVEVLAPNYFTGSPDFPEFEIENAIVVLPQERAQNTNAKVNGISYAGITETYSLYPQQPGDFQIPPVQLTVPYASNPPATTVVHLSLPTLTFHADLPVEARGLDYFLPTSQLTMQQKWSAPLKNIRVGDTLERTITVTAAKMQAMLIPPLPMDAPDGIRVYPGQPAVQDQKTSTGEFVFGRRTQSAQYFIQKQGDYTLPAVELKWWNLATKQMVAATLPPIHFVAGANPEFTTEVPPEPDAAVVMQPKPASPWARYKYRLELALLSIFSFLFLYWLGRRYLPRIASHMRIKREQRRHSESRYFSHLIRACHRNDAVESYVWLLRWLARWKPNALLEDFLAEAQDLHLSIEIKGLGRAVFSTAGGENQWTGSQLATLLKTIRKTKANKTWKAQFLLRLNP